MKALNSQESAEAPRLGRLRSLWSRALGVGEDASWAAGSSESEVWESLEAPLKGIYIYIEIDIGVGIDMDIDIGVDIDMDR